jgi:hypothetical protein
VRTSLGKKQTKKTIEQSIVFCFARKMAMTCASFCVQKRNSKKDKIFLKSKSKIVDGILIKCYNSIVKINRRQ